MSAAVTGHPLVCEQVPVSELRTYRHNPRQGDVAAIRSSLRVNGQYKPVVANRGTHTGRPGEVLAGNHTLMAARDEGWSDISVVWVDVDEDQAARIVLVDNRTSDLAGYDDRLLAELLATLPSLDGTGYDPGDLDALTALLQPHEHESGSDAAVLADTDRASWPVIRAQVPPEIHQRWSLVEGNDDAERVSTVLDLAGI